MRKPRCSPFDFLLLITRLREAALAEFARQLGPQNRVSAMCHLAETLLMVAQGSSSTEYVRWWLRKIEAHLDCDDARAASALTRALELAPKVH
jgi:hypothetical protein